MTEAEIEARIRATFKYCPECGKRLDRGQPHVCVSRIDVWPRYLEQNKNTRLTREQVNGIWIARRIDRLPIKTVTQQFGVAQSTLSKITAIRIDT